MVNTLAPNAKMRSPRFRTLAAAAGCPDDSTPPLPHNGRVEAGLQQVLDRAVAGRDVLLPGAIAYYRDPAYAPWAGSAGLRELQAQSRVCGEVAGPAAGVSDGRDTSACDFSHPFAS